MQLNHDVKYNVLKQLREYIMTPEKTESWGSEKLYIRGYPTVPMVD